MDRTKRAAERLWWVITRVFTGKFDHRVPQRMLEPGGKRRRAIQDFPHAVVNLPREFLREALGIENNGLAKLIIGLSLLALVGIIWG